MFLRKLFLKPMSGKMTEYRPGTNRFKLYILLSIGSICSVWISYGVAYGDDFYSKDGSPFGISNSDWVAKFWNWDFSANRPAN